MPRKVECPMIGGCHKGWREGLVMTSIGVSEGQKAEYKRELEKITGRSLEFRGTDPVAHSNGERNDLIRARNVLAERMDDPQIKPFHDQDGGYSNA